MEYKKSKWEREFEQYKTLDIKAEIEALEPKKDEEGFIVKRVGPEGEEKLKKLKIFEKNKDQIENLIAFRDKKRERLEKLKDALKEQENAKKDRETIKVESQKIEEEHKKLSEKKTELYNRMKSCKDSEEKKNLQSELKTVESELSKNDDKYIDNQNKMAELLGKKLDNKDYSKEISQTKTVISKCNMICKNLFEGKSWDDITVSLAQWKDSKFTSKDGKLAERVQAERQEIAKTENEKPVRTNPQVKQPEQQPEKEENGLINRSKFDWRHPVKSFKEWMQRRKEQKEGIIKSPEKAPEKGEKEEAEKKPETRNMDVVNKEVEFYKEIAIGPVAFRRNSKEQEEKAKREIEAHKGDSEER